MAREIEFVVSATIGTDDLVDFFTDALDCTVDDTGHGHRDGLDLRGHLSPAAEVDTLEGSPELLGPGDLPSVIFRFDNRASDETRQDSFLAVVTVVLDFFASRPEVSGLLEENSETVFLQRLPGGVVTFDDEWFRYAPDPSDPRLPALSAGHAAYRLPQPLL